MVNTQFAPKWRFSAVNQYSISGILCHIFAATEHPESRRYSNNNRRWHVDYLSIYSLGRFGSNMMWNFPAHESFYTTKHDKSWFFAHERPVISFLWRIISCAKHFFLRMCKFSAINHIIKLPYWQDL